MPALQIPEKLEKFMFAPKRFKVAFGGRGGAKSQSFADMLLYRADRHGSKVGCFREFQNSIDDSVYSLLIAEIKRMELSRFSYSQNRIMSDTGGLFKFKGLARNTDSAKSMFGFNVFWIEEAQSISKQSLKAITPTLREDGSECWLSLNPQSSADPISERFLEPFMAQLLEKGYYEDDLHIIVWINYKDNPWFPESLEMERRDDFERLPRNEYNHIWLGHYNDSIENSIIPVEWFEAAIDAHIKLGFKPVGVKVLSHDPSDEGADDKALCLRHGSVIQDIDVLGDGDSNAGMDWATDRAIKENIDLFAWDCDGMGISLKRQAEQALSGKKIDWQMFKGSEAADRPEEVYQPADTLHKTDKDKQRTNKETFKNKRSQYYWMLRDRFYNTFQAVTMGRYIDPDTMISISSEIKHINKFKAEICRIPKKYNGNGLIQIMPKDEMLRKYKIKSPNMADAAMMSLVTPATKASSAGPMEFDSLWGN